jgi:hypothetical protein
MLRLPVDRLGSTCVNALSADPFHWNTPCTVMLLTHVKRCAVGVISLIANRKSADMFEICHVT